jgi:phosphoribosylformylglycinamidine synthase
MNTESPLGFTVDLEHANIGHCSIQQQLFSEAQGRVVVSISPDKAREVIEEAVEHHVPIRVIGKVVEKDALIAMNGEKLLHFTIEDLSGAYYHALEHSLHLDEL